MVNQEFLARVDEMKRSGKYTEKEIANFFGLNTTELRVKISVSNYFNRQEFAKRAKELKEAGMNVSEIAKELGKNESTVRMLLEDKFAETIAEYWTQRRDRNIPKWHKDLVNEYLKNPERKAAVLPITC